MKRESLKDYKCAGQMSLFDYVDTFKGSDRIQWALYPGAWFGKCPVCHKNFIKAIPREADAVVIELQEHCDAELQMIGPENRFGLNWMHYPEKKPYPKDCSGCIYSGIEKADYDHTCDMCFAGECRLEAGEQIYFVSSTNIYKGIVKSIRGDVIRVDVSGRAYFISKWYRTRSEAETYLRTYYSGHISE